MDESKQLGFIGLGVMGEAMCDNLARKGGAPVFGYDLRGEPLERLAKVGVRPAASVAEVAAAADIVFLSLPGGAEVEEVCLGPGGIAEAGRAGQAVVDHSTAPVGLTRRVAAALADKGIAFADAPVARTRAAARAGTLSMMVGGETALFDRIRPYLACMATDVTRCGGAGAGQVVKLMNNMVLVETVVALAEALAVGRRAGVDGAVLMECLTKGSADSFAARNHGLKSLLPGDFPAEAFPARYALKDVGYALELAAQQGIDLPGAETARRLLERTVEAGLGDAYFPALYTVVDEPKSGD